MLKENTSIFILMAFALVLILVLMEHAQRVRFGASVYKMAPRVLILVLMEHAQRDRKSMCTPEFEKS